MRRANLYISISRKKILRATKALVSKWLRWHITDSSKSQALPRFWGILQSFCENDPGRIQRSFTFLGNVAKPSAL